MNEIPSDPEREEPAAEHLHGEIQHQAVTARIREDVIRGAFANAAIVLCGQFEVVIDFLLRMGKPERVMSRVILPITVAEQFVAALQGSLMNYEQQFGPLPTFRRSPEPDADKNTKANSQDQSAATVGTGQEKTSGDVESARPEDLGQTEKQMAENRPIPALPEIYEDLKIDDELLGGVYANTVLIRNSASEFCFDFVANIYPKSSVNARVFMAAAQVPALANSLNHSCQQYRRRFD